MYRGRNSNYKGNYSPQFSSPLPQEALSPQFPFQSPRPNFRSPQYQRDGTPWSSSPNYNSPQRQYSPYPHQKGFSSNSERSFQSFSSHSGGGFQRHQGHQRGRRNYSDASFNVHNYVEPSMLVDPWLELEQELRNQDQRNPEIQPDDKP